ncbi:MAG: 3-dehydroquinate synthase [Planctomycetota bacterium]|nr:3-dehydroquinate synthase [Planctomycetota bacterium]
MEQTRVSLKSTSSAYIVRIGADLLPEAAQEARAAARSRKAALVTDTNVAALYLEPALAALRGEGLAVEPIIVPAGEAAKTLAQAGRLYDAMLAMGLDRASAVVALGGGVVTDLAGFAAATYMRGIPWVGIATTLLAQVDASVGGKTAVDHPECKNLIGAFHQPAAVFADVATLASLPEEEFRTGLAEVVKHAVIRDAEMFALLELQADRILARDPAVLEQTVARNVRIKAEVVMADERESDLRRILNYGHTVGHAIESLAMQTPSQTGAPPMTHGRAVALGMVAEARIAERRGLVGHGVTDRQRRLLERFGLPVRAAGLDPARCLALMRHDKKAEAGRMVFVLPESIGAVRVANDVTDDEVREAILSLA